MQYGCRVTLNGDFLVVKESLERIGIVNHQKKIITPSCYILHKRGEYYIIHFKELLAMDGYKKDVSENDISRRNGIATLLQNWGLINIVETDVYQEKLKNSIYVLPYNEKENYTINHKYEISSSKGRKIA
jgi:hypothetical protein